MVALPRLLASISLLTALVSSTALAARDVPATPLSRAPRAARLPSLLESLRERPALTGAAPLRALGTPQWMGNGMPVTPLITEQFDPVLVTDGGTGLIATWGDFRSNRVDLYSRRLDSFGFSLGFPDDGLASAIADSNFILPTAASDGFGGSLIAYAEIGTFFNSIVHGPYVQRINSTGTRLWGTKGLRLGTGVALEIAVVPDGTGGALVGWSGIDPGMRMLRVDNSGAIASGWPVGGLTIGDSIYLAPMAPDGAGGAYVAWTGDDTVRVQRIGPTGSVVSGWPAKGLPVCQLSGSYKSDPVLTAVSGGAIVAWSDTRNYLNGDDVFAQRVTSAGAISWAPDGVALTGAGGPQLAFALVPDVGGGAIAVWQDYRSFSQADFYAQRVNNLGVIPAPWPADGALVCAAPATKIDAAAIADATGGLVVAWLDDRVNGSDFDLFAQRLLSTGARATGWPANGAVVCNDPSMPGNPSLSADGSGGAYVGWDDTRQGGYRAFLAHVTFDGTVPVEVALERAEATPDRVRLAWYSVENGSFGATLYRRENDSAWSTLAKVAADGSGHLRYEDREVVAGRRYGYRLGIAEPEGERFVGETWVDVPRASSLALAGARPNPPAGPLTIGFTLADDSPATLELLDLGGRRVRARAVGGLGAGEHVETLGDTDALPAGIYWLRLAQRGRALVAKTAIVR